MAKEDPTDGGRAGLDGLVAAASNVRVKEPPPVHLWNPPFCGDIDMRIARDGTWFYQKTPIGRLPLVKLFASILRKDDDRYVLVTPVERVGISVEDAPFLAVELAVANDAAGQILRFRTNVDDWVQAGPEHRLRFEPGDFGGLKPYIHVRGDLWALVSRALFYDLVGLATTREFGETAMFGVASGGAFFPLARADAVEGLA